MSGTANSGHVIDVQFSRLDVGILTIRGPCSVYLLGVASIIFPVCLLLLLKNHRRPAGRFFVNTVALEEKAPERWREMVPLLSSFPSHAST